MCGRYRLSRRKQLVEEYFASVSEEGEWGPRFNVAPTQPVLTIRRDSRARQETFHNAMGAYTLLVKRPEHRIQDNQREVREVATTASFREPFKSQRCLIPADGFYEWRKNGQTKQPYCFEMREGELFAFAGLWDRWRNPQGEVIESCTILTTTPNSLLADIHDRMPVILSPDNYDLWLDPAFRDTASVSEMLRPFDAALMRRYLVSARVNNVQNDDADCAKPLEREPSPAQSLLF